MSRTSMVTQVPTADWMMRATMAVVFVIALLLAAPQTAAARGMPDSFADLAEELLPAVVNISSVQTVQRPDAPGNLPGFPPGSPLEEFFERYFGQRGDEGERSPRRTQSLGSGFVIDPDGYIVTNNHVVSEAEEVTVRTTDGDEYEATIIGRDRQTDLALLKVEADKPLPAVEFGDSKVARVGDWVITIGNPFGLGGSVTAGIISARHRDLNSGPYDDFIQTDAPINRGNSGGPMFNLSGEVIGVNTAIFTPTGGNIGIGFAIPANQAQRVIEQLREFGRTRRGWLGVSIQNVTPDIAESLGLDNARGALVSTVNPGSPADEGGIEAGDIIVTFDDQEVPSWRELPRIVANTSIGKTVDVEVLRRGRERRLEITTGELPEEDIELAAADSAPSEPGPAADAILGMELSLVTSLLRQQYEIPETVDGVVVIDISRRSPAAERGLRPGDVIVQANQESVKKPDDVKATVATAKEADRSAVLFRMYRGGDYFHVALPLDEAEG